MNAENFTDQLHVLAALDDNPATRRTLRAFSSVPREKFAGRGPWKIRSPLANLTLPPRLTPDADPKWLYHSVLVVLDEEKGINIGDPSLWVSLLAHTDVQPGARVLQVGAGVGYYTAILRELVGPTGYVVAYEIEKALAERAARNLRNYKNVEVRHGNAATELKDMDEIDLVVGFAGVTHVPSRWTSQLKREARLLLPLTGEDCWGAMILAEQSEDGFDAITLGPCGFYPCAGARRDDLAVQVSTLMANPKHVRDWPIRIISRDGDIQLEAMA